MVAFGVFGDRQGGARPMKDARACSSVGVPPARVDLVIPHMYNPGDTALRYELRSFEKHGLLKHVHKVYLLVDNAVDKKAVQEQWRRHSQLSVVSIKDIAPPGFPWDRYHPTGTHHACSVLTMLAALIPRLEPWFVLLPDDNVLMHPFHMDMWYDFARNQPYAFAFGSANCGDTHGYANVAPLHGPSLLNTCEMWQTFEKWNPKLAFIDAVAVTTGRLRKHNIVSRTFSYADKIGRASCRERV